jgi:hypothetical protein
MVIDTKKQIHCHLHTKYRDEIEIKAFESCFYRFHYKWSVLAEPTKHWPTEPEHRPIVADLRHCQAIDNH